MKLSEFKKAYLFYTTTTEAKDKMLVIKTSLIDKVQNKQILSVSKSHDIFNTNELIKNAGIFQSYVTWDYLKDQTVRMHLDHFMKMFGVNDFYPLNTDNKIDHLYI